MKAEAAPWWGILVVAPVLTAAWAWNAFTFYTFSDDIRRQFNRPQLKEGESRFGRVTSLLEVHDLEPNQLVRFAIPRSGGESTARVIALEGQRVRLEAGEVLVDGEPFPDEYARSRNGETIPEMVVPAGCVYVLNDQRGGANQFYDSRTLGPIPFRAVSRRFAPKELQRR